MTLVGWVLKRNVNRMDEHQRRIELLERDSVDDSKLEQTIRRIEGKIDEGTREVREEFRAVHKRIDEAFKR